MNESFRAFSYSCWVILIVVVLIASQKPKDGNDGWNLHFDMYTASVVASLVMLTISLTLLFRFGDLLSYAIGLTFRRWLP